MSGARDETRHKEFLSLFSGAAGALHTFVWCLLPRGDEADDLFQELSYRLWKDFDRFDRSRPFLPWARGVARHMVMEHRRRGSRSVAMSEAVIDQLVQLSTEQDSSAGDRQEALRRCVQKLQDADRAMLRMRYQQQRLPRDIAAQQGLSIHQVYRALTRIHRSLLNCIRNSLAQGRQS